MSTHQTKGIVVMPISPSVVSAKRPEKGILGKIYHHVDNRLRLGVDALSMYRLGKGYRFHIVGEVSSAEREEVVRQYRNAGWSGVKIINSAEHGKMPGLLSVFLEP